MEFDAIDQKILTILRADGRASHAALAKDVGLSAPAVSERIRKLEQSGVIEGYRAVLNPEKLGLMIAAFIAITPRPGKPGKLIVTGLLALPQVEELHGVAGDYSYIAKVRIQSPRELDALLDQLFMVEGVERTHTIMILRTNKERATYLPFSALPFSATDSATEVTLQPDEQDE